MSESQKIVVLGLDNAGKTSLLSTFGGRLGIEDLASLEPTRGVKRNEIDAEDMKFYIWDFGGQVDHRSQYLEDPEKYFSGIDLLIYVIDVRDKERYKESLNYFKNIFNILKELGEDPYCLIFIHKYDPEIKNDEEILSDVKELKTEMKEVLEKRSHRYEFYLTSIYSMFPDHPKFVDLVRDLIEGESISQGVLERKIETLSTVLETTINSVIKLSSKVMEMEKFFKSLQKSIKEEMIYDMEAPTSKPNEIKANYLKIKALSQLKNIIVQKERNE
ncbi:MAG: hypothetical protein BAJALOKI2v1_250023 [Promethearchaeota archaeon]|nr:MAG: hypothetical protein BAJALOKI2v1_250023 [Candidatus Lokiarchaeota archaeon]